MTEEGEALRRRLYRPGADETDVDAYLSVAPPPPAEPAPAPAPRRSRVWIAVVAVVALLAVAAVAVPRIVRAAAPPAVAGPTPLPTGTVDPATSARFVAALDAGHDAGLGAWWDPKAPFLEEHGRGDATVQLPPSGSSTGGGLVVLLVLAKDGTAGWETARLVITPTHAIVRERESGADGALRAGVPTVARIAYAADHRPLRLLVHAPAGSRWGVAAIFTR